MRSRGWGKMKDLIIIGAGGFGREVAWLVERINEQSPAWNLLGFVDDDSSVQNTIVDDYPVLGNVGLLCSYASEVCVVCSIAKPSIRNMIVDKCKKNLQLSFPTLIDPLVTVGKKNSVGKGCIICAGSIITIDAQVRDFSIINLSCTIGHDAVLGEYVTLYPTVNVSGHVTIGNHTEIGTGSQIIQGLSIGEHAVVGAGSVVVRDIPSHCTAVGVPAKPIKFQ